MSDQPSPLLMVGSSGQVVDRTAYMIRLTPFMKFNRKDVVDWMNTQEGSQDEFIISTELSSAGHEHYHMLVWSDLSEEELRADVKEFLYTFWPTRGRGFGNKQYNLQVVEDLMAYAPYIMKDGKVQFTSGVNLEFIEFCKKKSFPKFTKQGFAQEFEELRERYKTKLYDMRHFMIDFVNLKAKYRQPIDMGYVYRVALAQDLHIRPHRTVNLVDEYLERLSRFR